MPEAGDGFNKDRLSIYKDSHYKNKTIVIFVTGITVQEKWHLYIGMGPIYLGHG